MKRMILPPKPPARVVVISIDGVPYSFLQARMAAGALPNFQQLLAHGSLHRMNSVQPCVSSVAWASYMTGKNPGKHNIFGFVEKKPGTLDTFVPTAANLAGDTIWEIMSRAGKKVCVINVPGTFPPRPVNGIMIGCFLGTQLENIAYPKKVGAELQALGYKIDARAALAREDLDRFIAECRHVLAKRAATLLHFLTKTPWDFFQCHIMETDRLNHFLWERAENGDARYRRAFDEFYQQVDALIGEVVSRLDQETELLILSDHGFCAIKKEIYLNHYFVETGLLKFKTASPRSLRDMQAESVAYSLIPGRVFINLKGREPHGTVAPELYESVREQVAKTLLSLHDDDGAPIIREVIKRENIFSGPSLNTAADLLAIPHDGYDLKADVTKAVRGEKTALAGMHTFDDALFYIRRPHVPLGENKFWIGDVAPTILQLMHLPIPEDMDGVALEV